MPTNWKYIKKVLEKEFLCEKLCGHITYDLTDYRPAPWYQQHFIMKYDDEVLLDVQQPERMWNKEYDRTDINWSHRDIIVERLYEKYKLSEYDLPKRTLDRITADVISDYDKLISHHKGLFGVHDIIDAIGIYLHADINTCLVYGQDSFINALAILDRRCGRRRLKKFAKWEYTGMPDWLRRIYQIRFETENINYSKHYKIIHGEETK